MNKDSKKLTLVRQIIAFSISGSFSAFLADKLNRYVINNAALSNIITSTIISPITIVPIVRSLVVFQLPSLDAFYFDSYKLRSILINCIPLPFLQTISPYMYYYVEKFLRRFTDNPQIIHIGKFSSTGITMTLTIGLLSQRVFKDVEKPTFESLLYYSGIMSVLPAIISILGDQIKFIPDSQ